MHRILAPDLRFAASPALLERGCVNVIGLEEIKAGADSRWEKMRSSICAHLESLLRQTLGPADFFAQLDPTSFLICTPGTTQEESQVLCLRIAHELHTNLLGACDIDQIRVARAASFDGNALDVEAIEGEDLIRLAGQAGFMIPSGRPRLARAAPPIAHSVAQKPQHTHKFVPMWDVQREAITAYRCVTAADHTEYDRAQANAQFKANVAAMLSRVRHATRTLAENLKAARRFLMAIPVSYDLLGSPVARMEVTSICRNLSSELRPYLIFEIVELPYGVPQCRLSELVGSLRPFCRGVSAILQTQVPQLGTYQGAGLCAIGQSFASTDSDAAEAAHKGFEAGVRALTTAAKKLHLHSCVLDVASVAAARYARDVGANVLSGPIIGAPTTMPSPIRRLSMQDIEGPAGDEGSSCEYTAPRTGTSG
jgi:EAL domain-containing protein (putative c-di-GMP-specific phosphodiesterase class I)